MEKLNLSELRKGIPAITPAWSIVLAEASAYCLTDQGHSPGVVLQVDGSYDQKMELNWDFIVDDNINRCYEDQETATEWGATGISFLLILRLTQFTAIERSRKGTGFDFWLGHREDVDQYIFSNKARLEISGIRKGNVNDVNKRAKIKIKQTDRSDETTQLPAYISIVEFSQPYSRISEK